MAPYPLKKLSHFTILGRFRVSILLSHTGECSYFGAEQISQQIKEHQIDFLLGVGGGKLADLVGYSAHLNNLNFGLVPTLASNCAPWTPLAVMYQENGAAEGKTEHFFRQAAF